MSSQSSWKDRIAAVASAPPGAAPANPLAKTLEEFRTLLDSSPWIRAELRPGPHPRMLALVVLPKYRRDISATMLTFWLNPGGVTVLGADGQNFDGEEALKEYLADFVEKSAFPGTVAEFSAIQGENVHGTLRVKSLLEDDPADVPVLVDAADHTALAKRALEGKLDTSCTVGVALEEHPSMGAFNEATHYEYLESAGFGLRIQSTTPVGLKTLRLHGDVVAVDDLPK